MRPSTFRTALSLYSVRTHGTLYNENRISNAFRIAEIYLPSDYKSRTSPPRAAASKLASIIPAVVRHDSRLQSRCHFTCGRHRSSGGCCSAGSVVGALTEDHVYHSSTRAYRTREIPLAHLLCMVVRRGHTMSASVHCVRCMNSLCCAGERSVLPGRAAIERCGMCLFFCLFVPRIGGRGGSSERCRCFPSQWTSRSIREGHISSI